MRTANKERALAILSPLAVVALWQFASNMGWTNQRYVPSPLAIAQAGWDLALSGRLAIDIGASLRRLAIGFVLGAVPGILLGMIMGLNRWVRAAIDPLIAALYPIPKIAILPLLMLAFGLGDASKVAVVAMSVLFLTIINTTTGVVQLDRIYFEVARNYGTPWYKLFTRVILPGALPSIFVGLRYSLGIMWLTLIVAETISASSGLGYMAMEAREFMLVDVVVLAILIYAALGKVADGTVRLLERVCLSWPPAFADPRGAQ